MKLSRQEFLRMSMISTAGLIVPSFPVFQKKDKGPQIKPELVKEFVTVGHGNFDKTKEMLNELPALLNATWDWGGGDYETALGGASHVGNRDIAEYLIKAGARYDIFSAIMLGKLELVKSMLTIFPETINAKGPHGLSLIHHAKKGGDEALPVLEYLQSLGAS